MKLADKIAMKIAWLLPKKVVYWAALRLIGYATIGQYGNTLVSELPAMVALDRWNEGGI